MTTFFAVRIILPTFFDAESIPSEVLEQLNTEEKKIVELYEKTVRTWTRRPRFLVTRKMGKNIDVLVQADNTKGGDIHRYLDAGISDRRAVMEDGYSRKTRVGMVGSWPAGGRRTPIFISKKKINKSIQARKWSPIITERRDHPFKWNMDLAVRRGAKRLFYD